MLITETGRLLLRHLTPNDVGPLMAVRGDPVVMRFGDGACTREQVGAWVKEMIERHYPAWGFGVWAVVRKDNREVIGHCGLHRFGDRCGPEEAELAYRLALPHWGQGYGSEAARAACDHARHRLGIGRIIAIIDPANSASIRVALNVGMTFEREIMLPGYDHADHLYAVDWNTRP